MRAVGLALCLTTLLASGTSAQIRRGVDPAPLYAQYIHAIQEQYRALAEVEARLDGVQATRKYLKSRLKEDRLPDDVRDRMQRELEEFDRIDSQLRQWVKDTKAWFRTMTGWLQEQMVQWPEFGPWERTRRSLWRRGPPVSMTLEPEPPVANEQEVEARLVGLPRGVTVSWEAPYGVLEVDPEDATRAVWSSGGDTRDCLLAAHLTLPGTDFPWKVARLVVTGGPITIPPREKVNQYRDALTQLINQEAALEQEEDRISRLREQLRALRGEHAEAAEAEVKRLQDLARVRQGWIEYYDVYYLPRLGEMPDRYAAHWELQRQGLKTDRGKFPMRIVPGGEGSATRWHFKLTGAPEGTEMAWRLQDTLPGSVEEDLASAVSPLEVFVDAPRSREKILIAYPKPPFTDLPIRLEWRLPPLSPRKGE